MILSLREARRGALALILLPSFLGILGIYILVAHALAYAFSILPCTLMPFHTAHIESLHRKMRKFQLLGFRFPSFSTCIGSTLSGMGAFYMIIERMFWCIQLLAYFTTKSVIFMDVLMMFQQNVRCKFSSAHVTFVMSPFNVLIQMSFKCIQCSTWRWANFASQMLWINAWMQRNLWWDHLNVAHVTLYFLDSVSYPKVVY